MRYRGNKICLDGRKWRKDSPKIYCLRRECWLAKVEKRASWKETEGSSISYNLATFLNIKETWLWLWLLIFWFGGCTWLSIIAIWWWWWWWCVTGWWRTQCTFGNRLWRRFLTCTALCCYNQRALKQCTPLLRKKVKVKASHARYRALGPELIPVYRQSARTWLKLSTRR